MKSNIYVLKYGVKATKDRRTENRLCILVGIAHFDQAPVGDNRGSKIIVHSGILNLCV